MFSGNFTVWEFAGSELLIVPLFLILGYDVWNPLEVQPEYGADFTKGAKKGQLEKVDYALKINGEPVIFVECKAADVVLDAFDAQLARYFNSTPSVRVGILTNGVRIKVFTDLQQPNVMDDKPWMDFDVRTPKQAEIDALKKFRKTEFTADQIVGLAEEMVYYNVLVPFMASQLLDPGDKLVRLVAEEIPSIKRIDKKVVDRLTPILRKAIQAAILDHVARSFDAPTQPELIRSSVVDSQRCLASSNLSSNLDPAKTIPESFAMPRKNENIPTVNTSIEEKNEHKQAIEYNFDPLNPPDLTHTKCHGKFGNITFYEWAVLLRLAHVQAFSKVQSFDILTNITKAPIKKGNYHRVDGYYFIDEINISIRGVSANSAWKYAIHLASYLNTTLEVWVEWRQHEEAAYPGQKGFMRWIPHP